jgi:hypothetical protein
VSLLPGEAVSVKNIFTKVSEIVFDRDWQKINLLRDDAEAKIREIRQSEIITKLAGQDHGIFSWWDRIVRSLL